MVYRPPRHLLLGLAVLGGLLSMSRVGHAQLAVEDVLKAYDSACATIATFDVSLKVVSHPMYVTDHGKLRRLTKREAAATGQPIRRSRQYSRDGRFRADLIGTEAGSIAPGTTTIVWDGVEEKTLNGESRRGTISPNSDSWRAVCEVAFTELYQLYSPSYSYSQIVRDRSPQRVSVSREGNAIVLVALPESEKPVSLSNRGVRLELDPTQGFLPTRIEYLRDGGGGKPVLWTRYENTLAKTQSGLWVPVRSRRSTFDSEQRSETFGQVIGYQDIEIDLGRARFDEEIDRSLFDVRFPVGTVVFDQTSRTAHVVGHKNREAYLDQLAIEGRLGVEELRKAPQAGSHATNLSYRPRQFTLVGVNLVLLSSLVLTTVYRRLKSQGRGQSAAAP